MEDQSFNVEQVSHFWMTEAEEALHVADHLMEKADYSYALFFGHLAIEKLLKALYAVRKNEHAPPVHNLTRLCKAIGLEPDDRKRDALITITAFNIEARYPDMKRSFRRKCTAAYTAEQMGVIKEVFEWLKSKIASP